MNRCRAAARVICAESLTPVRNHCLLCLRHTGSRTRATQQRLNPSAPTRPPRSITRWALDPHLRVPDAQGPGVTPVLEPVPRSGKSHLCGIADSCAESLPPVPAAHRFENLCHPAAGQIHCCRAASGPSLPYSPQVSNRVRETVGRNGGLVRRPACNECS